ncbi:hypothetical protein [Tsukamurella paurometabola]|uniref:Uncharacterized protein n=1 Tax=Tsukamurella paurometabola TaxID=2061 RepID=A0ABS5NF91_TSUPA|nr:hypothetical protein [Tsukamurella paurometabola]MBS4102936.1 hypothetical protein [Tsukamurella paurometabola]
MTNRTPFAVTLGVCTAVSLAGNVGAATLLPHTLTLPTPAVIAAASVAPLLLPAAVHLVPRAAGLPKGARGVVVFAVIVASIAAFALSFASLMAVAQASGHPGLLGALLPLAVDVLAGAAAYALVVMPADAPATEQPVHQPEQADAPAYPATLTWLAPVHQPAGPRTVERSVEPVDQVDDRPVDQTPAPVVQPEPQVVHTPVDQTLDHPATRGDAVTEPRAVQSVDQVVEPVSHHPTAEVDRDQEPVNRRPLALVDQPVNRDVDHRAIAEQVAARTASDWTVDQLERVSRSTPGVGQRVLAEQLGVSPSTVNRMRKAIAQVAGDSDAEESEPEPALA